MYLFFSCAVSAVMSMMDWRDNISHYNGRRRGRRLLHCKHGGNRGGRWPPSSLSSALQLSLIRLADRKLDFFYWGQGVVFMSSCLHVFTHQPSSSASTETPTSWERKTQASPGPQLGPLMGPTWTHSGTRPGPLLGPIMGPLLGPHLDSPPGTPPGPLLGPLMGPTWTHSGTPPGPLLGPLMGPYLDPLMGPHLDP